MRPRADEVLRSAIWTFDTHLLPELADPYARSLGLTVGNMLRHVLARLEHEGQALTDDITELRTVLASVRDYLAAEAVPAGAVDGAVVDELHRALAAGTRGPGEYPTLTRLTDAATALRDALDAALRALQAARPALGGSPAYDAARREIRLYLRHQVERELPLVAGAFTGERR